MRNILISIILLCCCTSLLAQERGMATYYANRLHGRKMSDGTRYHKDSLTCAHKRYPLGTILKVTRISNGESVIVKVTDRCGKSCFIDLSYAAAKKIGMISAGRVSVKVEKYVKPDIAPFRFDFNDIMPEIDVAEAEDDDGDITPIWQKDRKE